MGSTIAEFLAKLFGKKIGHKVIIMGLDAVGKTTTLYKLKFPNEPPVVTIPTIGFNVETISYKKFDFTMWDVGGCDKIRPLWRHYFQETSAVLFVIDSHDRERLPETISEFNHVLREDELRDAVILILANKQDLPNAISVSEISQMFGLDKLKRACYIQPTKVLEGVGLYEGMDWLCSILSGGKVQQPKLEKPLSMELNQPQDLLTQWLQQEDEPDDVFLEQLADCTLKSWDHRTHLRLAWLFLVRLGRKKGMEMIFSNIKNFIEKSPVSRKTTFHETMTYFWAHMVHYAIVSNYSPTIDFKGFLLMNPQLSNGGLFLEYYNKDTMLNNPTARSQVVLPDKKPLPSIIGHGLSTTVQEKEELIETKEDDDQFLSKFQDLTLDHWDHLDLLRVNYLYLKIYGRRKASSLVLDHVQKFIQNSDVAKGKTFHITQMFFWIHMMDYAMNVSKGANSLEEVLKQNPDLKKPRWFLEYYKIDTILTGFKAQKEVALPDKKPFPNIIP